MRVYRLWKCPCMCISAVCMRKRHLQCKITLNFQYSTYSYMQPPQMQPSCFVLGTSPRVATLVRQFCTSDLEKGNDSREGAQDIQRAIIEIQAKDGNTLNAIGQVCLCVWFCSTSYETNLYLVIHCQFHFFLTTLTIVTTLY